MVSLHRQRASQALTHLLRVFNAPLGSQHELRTNGPFTECWISQVTVMHKHVDRWCLLAAVLFASFCVGGCRPIDSGTREKSHPFWHKFLPREDFLWDPRSREIEQNLQRENTISIQ